MSIKNPHAVYINCDGAMDYDKHNTGGVGFVISFPDNTKLEEIQISKGSYIGGNIERIEYEALIQGMQFILKLFSDKKSELKSISQIIFISDRYALNDNERTNPYRIKELRKNNWKNFEGKPIKNHELLDKLDKLRKKISVQTGCRINIEYWPRKKNKVADKLAKAGKNLGGNNSSLSKKGEKIGKRMFDGAELKYSRLQIGMELHIHVFRKDPVQTEWEVWVEIIHGELLGHKLKIYAGNELTAELKRRNKYIIKVANVFRYHITIEKNIKRLS